MVKNIYQFGSLQPDIRPGQDCGDYRQSVYAHAGKQGGDLPVDSPDNYNGNGDGLADCL